MHEHFTSDVHRHTLLGKLNRLAQRVAHLALHVLVRTPDSLVELHPAGHAQTLPPFCTIFRDTPHGERYCHACRTRVASSVCSRGPGAFACHGGLTVFASPAIRHNGSWSNRLVVATCVVTHRNHAHAWRSVASHASELGLAPRRLHQAFFTLPAIDTRTRPLITETIELAAHVLGEVEDNLAPDAPFPRRASRAVPHPTGSMVVDAALAAITRDPAHPHTLDSIARSLGVTPNHLSAAFHQRTGITYREYLTEQRMARACEMLTDVRLSVSEVAARSGFADPAYFSRRFRQRTGLTPTQWRNRSGADST